MEGRKRIGCSRAVLQQPVGAQTADETRLASPRWGDAPLNVLALSQVTEHCVARRRHQTRWTETKHHPWLHRARVLSEDPHPGWAACPERESREVLQVSCSSNWLWGINNKYSDKQKKRKTTITLLYVLCNHFNLHFQNKQIEMIFPSTEAWS